MKLNYLEGLFSSVIVLGYNIKQPLMNKSLKMMAKDSNTSFEEVVFNMVKSYLKSNYIRVLEKDVPFIKELLHQGELIINLDNYSQDMLMECVRFAKENTLCVE